MSQSGPLLWRALYTGTAKSAYYSHRVRLKYATSAVRTSGTRVTSMHHSTPKVAVLHQALEPPIVNGVQKPRKPGGYKDSGADIAYVLKTQCNIPVITPATSPDPQSDEGWTFPDTESGIVDAIKGGATCLWANTILLAQHPLQTSSALTQHCQSVTVVGQPPLLVDAYDDKAFVNGMLRERSDVPVSRFITLDRSGLTDVAGLLSSEKLQLPLVVKPIRGRGSHGVKVCRSIDELTGHANALFAESPKIMLEEFLPGEEGTVTVMPPSKARSRYWAMPVVLRFNHADDIAPYNGVVAVTQNSRVVSVDRARNEPAFVQVGKDCEAVAELLQVKAPIRIDVRKTSKATEAPFTLFDINMKPNMTAPGRPGREGQASLTAMAAVGLGWDARTLLTEILATACTLQELRRTKLPFLS